MVAAAPASAAPFTPDLAPGRLPKNVVPVSYAITIVPDVAARTFAGRESIVVEMREATATVQFNSLNETLEDVRFDGKAVERVSTDDRVQLTTLTLASPARVGVHRLSFAYRGTIERQAHGLFAQEYRDPSGRTRIMLSTQMEATDARRMFPCWDEPAFRATFKLTATVRADWATISNMPVQKRVIRGDLATTTFEQSPRMPSYLVEFTAGEMDRISASESGTEFGVWAARGRAKDGAAALANARTILADYNDYFAYPYPLPKLDSIAVPGGVQGAMENWGAITYNDQTLLLSETSSIGNRQTVFSIQAHEMAHQWNGDLVTMAWWDDLWLNESFASWMAAKETALRNPDWKWWEAQDADKESAMNADARVASHPIQQRVTDELQALNAFDSQITYSKGQAILRMFEAYLGADTFRAGIRGYMRAHAFSNATTQDLWNALRAGSGRDIAGIASDWTTKAGFPLIGVAAACDAAGARTLTLSQRRFILAGGGQASDWKVPLQIRSGTDGRPQPLLLTEDGQSAPAGRCDEPLSINAGALGYFRAHYDAPTLATNTQHFGGLPDPDRIALLDDQWALVESGTDPLPSYMALASSMGSDLDTRAWSQITQALGTLEYDERGSDGHAAFAARARSILQPVFESLGWRPKEGETPDVGILRRLVIRNLGSWDDAAVIEEARRRFAQFLTDPGAISPDDQGAILTIVAQHADKADFDRLHAIARGAKDETEMRRYYAALMAVRDPALAREAAAIALSGEIAPQAEALRLHLVTTLSLADPQLSWSVFRDHSQRLLEPFSMNGPLLVAQQIPEIYWQVPFTDLAPWVRGHVPAEMGPDVDRGLEAARFKLAEKHRLVAATDEYLRALK
jgi:aminopeptidase N